MTVQTSSPRRIRAVYFDVGETLINESTEYGTWADWLGVPRHTFSAVFGQVIAQGRDYREVFQHFQPGFDLALERQRRAEAGLAEHFNGRDLYPDVRDCLAALKADGYFVGVAGNQTARAGRLLHELNLGVDLIATSDDWGAEKPTSEFFVKLVESAGCAPEEIAYVGDRLDNDILPALAAGLTTVFIRRGPWGYFYATRPEVEQAHIRIDNLRDLPRRLRDIQFR
ncbi:HAD family hydrolase [Micromonospora andamanensis]|uniref:Haloacid dehalogenase n=1 Tax=Micromonospora andamanensis TaxID=1287068 RepID=A0ABQ4I367_9ACTN|nr:HAD family hydrolase [Micromonospora andamanensis]GIJ12338.1 haloacid dehalogenase [Micromonospora andamanensis]